MIGNAYRAQKLRCLERGKMSETCTCGVDLALRGHREESLFASNKLDGPEDGEAFARGRRFHFGPVDTSQLEKGKNS